MLQYIKHVGQVFLIIKEKNIVVNFKMIMIL